MFSTTRTFVLALAAAAGISQLLYAQTEPLTNDDVVRMVQAQLSMPVIHAALESANVSFNLSPEGLIALKAAGVDDRTIETMQAKTQARNTGTTTDAVSRNGPEKS